MGVEALALNEVSIRLGSANILHDVSLNVAAGSFTCLLGPSGCGKTTLLRAIAGFAPLSGGEIRIGDRSIGALPPEKRETAMVFQSYALWPHMNVGANLAYPLKLRGVARAERDQRVADILALLDLDGYASRPVTSLSGGQRQRVALGRALIIDPPILLLDEPLSNLDAAIRRNLRSELRNLQRRVGITTIMVTHDQEEALSMADTIVLMRAGRVVQIADPATLYSRPADIDAAKFLGVDNLVARQSADQAPGQDGDVLGFRSSDAQIVLAQPVSGLVREGVVADCAYVGGSYQVLVTHENARFTAMSAAPVAMGTAVFVAVPTPSLIGFGAHGAMSTH